MDSYHSSDIALIPVFLSGTLSNASSNWFCGSTWIGSWGVFVTGFFLLGSAFLTAGFLSEFSLTKLTFKRSIVWSRGIYLCASAVMIVESMPPLNRTATRLAPEFVQHGGGRCLTSSSAVIQKYYLFFPQPDWVHSRRHPRSSKTHLLIWRDRSKAIDCCSMEHWSSFVSWMDKTDCQYIEITPIPLRGRTPDFQGTCACKYLAMSTLSVEHSTLKWMWTVRHKIVLVPALSMERVLHIHLHFPQNFRSCWKCSHLRCSKPETANPGWLVLQVRQKQQRLTQSLHNDNQAGCLVCCAWMSLENAQPDFFVQSNFFQTTKCCWRPWIQYLKLWVLTCQYISDQGPLMSCNKHGMEIPFSSLDNASNNTSPSFWLCWICKSLLSESNISPFHNRKLPCLSLMGCWVTQKSDTTP